MSIREQKTLRFTYNGELRSVEPHCYGVQQNGKEALLAWQLSGGSGVGYRMFLVDDLAEVQIEKKFAGPRLRYQSGDRRFIMIYEQL